jgi:prevent-host-death family protein
MEMVNIHEAKTHLSRLIKKVINGDEVIIAKGNKPVAKLIQYHSKKIQRTIGSAKGKVTVAEDFNKVAEDFKEYLE